MLFDHRLSRMCLSVALAAALCLVVCSSLQAQTTSASVAGSVKDAQGGVLPGATVTLTSSTQGTVLTVVTDDLGNFFFSYVRPDTYTLKISLQGFQSAERKSLVVNASDRLTAGTFTLQIGQVAETITVTGQSTDIQLRSGERAFTLQSEAMQNIAVNGRSFFGLAMLVPGIVASSDTPTQVSNLQSNGQRANANNMTIDGVNNIDTGDNGGNMAQTNLDAIAEFKVLTSSYQAEYGRATGAQVQVVTKSGSRDFRGSGYWYARRSAWNENTYLNKRAGIAMAKSARNDAGYTIGGPVFIPGLFNKDRNKLFFFWSQEFQRRTDPVGQRRATVPTLLERKGDFSQSVDANGNPYPYIRDYTTGLSCSASDTSGCFADGGVLGKIPANRLYAPTLAGLSIFPEPNTTGAKGYNYTSQAPDKNPMNQQLFKADFQVNSNWRVAGRYMWHSNKQELAYGLQWWSIGSTNPGVDGLHVISDVPGRNWMLSTTGIINNTTALEISFGQAHNSLTHYTEEQKFTRAGAGMSALPMLYPDSIQNDYIPDMRFGGGRIANSAYYHIGQAPFTNFNTTNDLVANLTKVMGTHAAKAGLYYQHSLKPQSAFAQVNGQIYFDNSSSNAYDSTHPYANAALGIYNSFTQASAYVKPNWVYKNIEWYLQDNWKTTERLTLDYGVRFYYLTPQWDSSEKAANFKPDDFVASQAVRLFQPAVVNGVRMGYDAKTGQTVIAAYIGRVVPGSGDQFQGTFKGGTLTDGNKFKVSPRLGFAYDITGKQSLIARGGFGIFYDRVQGNMVFDMAVNPPAMRQPTLQWLLASQVTPGASTGYDPTVGLSPTEYAWAVPTVYQWNFGVQWKLPAAFVLDMSYVGSTSKSLLQGNQLNAVPYGTAYLAQSQDPTRGQTCSGCSTLSTTPGANALPTDLMRPYQGYGGIRMYEFRSYGDYKALQTTVSRRFAKGLMFGINYTLSSARGILNQDFDNTRIDGKAREADYGPLGYDRTHVITSSFVYQAPNFKDGALGYLTNGWQISGNFRRLSGTPYTAGFSIPGIGNVNLTGSPDGYARIVLTGKEISRGWSDDEYNQFNVAAFTAPQTGSVGLESPRFTMRNHPTSTLDLSVSKSFPLGGKRRFEIRVDAFNALNTVNFTAVNSTINFKSLTDSTITNLPYDSSGNLVNKTGVGTISSTGSARQLQIMTRFTF
ncbi:MAG: carboxypeptidase regulatory-like domain-containing protein [Planctomycetes bacterium]|nr:carboxypeptidase regulatory-like domain-containing protein [Planctomycetota bacterium]